MIRLIRELVRPYRGSLLIILLAMLVETAMSLATPWPLKVIIDNVVGHHQMSPWLVDLLRPWMDGKHQMHIAAVAAGAYVVIAVLGALASYIDNYYTESVGQYVAHDLRLRTFHHLQRLSLGYYNTHQTGPLLSTITTDIQTIQGFASSSTLSILVDLLTIICMLALMFWLNWDFTLIAVGVTPFLLCSFHASRKR
jgi:subfamily B ATP-binding cassette protein MsbA